MVTLARIQIDRRGVGEVAKSREMKALIHDLAEEVAENVRDLGIMVNGIPGTDVLPVKVSDSVTDRAVSRVSITHPAGLAVQAKHGALSKAASAAGLKLKGD